MKSFETSANPERFPHKTYSSSQAQGGYWLEWPAHSGTLEKAGSGWQAPQLANFSGSRVGKGQCSHLVKSGEMAMAMVLGAGGRWLEQWLVGQAGPESAGEGSGQCVGPGDVVKPWSSVCIK